MLILAALALAGCTAAEFRAAKQDIGTAFDDAKALTLDLVGKLKPLSADKTQKRPDC